MNSWEFWYGIKPTKSFPATLIRRWVEAVPTPQDSTSQFFHLAGKHNNSAGRGLNFQPGGAALQCADTVLVVHTMGHRSDQQLPHNLHLPDTESGHVSDTGIPKKTCFSSSSNKSAFEKRHARSEPLQGSHGGNTTLDLRLAVTSAANANTFINKLGGQFSNKVEATH